MLKNLFDLFAKEKNYNLRQRSTTSISKDFLGNLEISCG